LCQRAVQTLKRLDEPSSLQRKKILSFAFRFFCGDVVIWVGLGLSEGNISLKFLVETRLKSKFCKPLIDFLAFLVQTLWQNNQNLGKKSFWVVFTHI